MNESELEQKLRSLRPSRPSHELEVNIGRELAPAPIARAGILVAERKSWLERLAPALGWAGLGAAAAVIAMLSLNLLNGGPHPKSDEVRPVLQASAPEGQAASPSISDAALAAEDVLDASYDGVVDDGENGIGRRIRYSSIERRSWTETDGAVTVVEIPREDVVVLPVSVQ